MAMAKRGSRELSVEGVQYRWKVRDRKAFEEAGPASYMHVVVELAADPRRVLKLTFPRAPTDDWLWASGHVITPRQVAGWIQRARSSGWEPAEPGPVFDLMLTDADLVSAAEAQ